MTFHSTLSRPLGLSERFYHEARGPRGGADIFLIFTLEHASGPIKSDDVAHAWALMSLHHPILASRVAYNDPDPTLIYTPPCSVAEALRTAQAHLEFATFLSGERDAAASALRRRLVSMEHDSDVLHPRENLSTLCWLAADVAAQEKPSEYVLCIRATHFATDATALFNVARQLLELLSVPGRAELELYETFSNGSPTLQGLPEALEDLIPKPTTTAVLDATPRLRQFGLFPDGIITDETVVGRALRHTWSTADTARIVRACKAHGVTVTQLLCAALAVAALPPSPLPLDASTDKLHFTFRPAVDLRAILPPPPSPVALRVGHFPLSIDLSCDAAAHPASATWAAARQARESSAEFFASSHKWHILQEAKARALAAIAAARAGASDAPNLFAAPFLPSLSSLGVCDAVLPAQYGEIGVRDMVLAAQTLPMIMSFHVWTWAGCLNMHVTHNTAHTSAVFTDAYFQKVVDVISCAVVGDKEC
ncbi:hypothetical protein B0H21DRAFT_765544 [Amylocystis lapponica]|nr:hypothetical protein B0H21DRAFT_765544 [Amylocystis lapponica]